MTKHEVIEHALELEGIFSDDKDDSGGATKYGITEKKAREHSYLGNMVDLSRDFAIMVYRDDYWDKLKLSNFLIHGLNSSCYELFECAVNCGTGTAAKFLQHSLNALNQRRKTLSPWDSGWLTDLKVDGVVGKKTLWWLDNFLSEGTRYRKSGVPTGRVNRIDNLIASMVNAQQGTYYINLAETRRKDRKYVKGWFEQRVMKTYKSRKLA